MSDTRVFDYDPLTGITTLYHGDTEHGEGFHLQRIQDERPFIDHLKRLQNCVDERANWKGDMHRVASIPNIVIEQHPELLTDENALRKFLNDSSNMYFRTRPGRI